MSKLTPRARMVRKAFIPQGAAPVFFVHVHESYDDYVHRCRACEYEDGYNPEEIY